MVDRSLRKDPIHRTSVWFTRRFLKLCSSRCRRVQNYIANYLNSYKIREGRYSPPRFPLGVRTFAQRLTFSSASSEGSYGPEYNPSRSLTSLLLKPTSAIRPTALLSLKTDTRVRPLGPYRQCHCRCHYMPRPAVVRLFRVTLPGLPFTARPTVSCRSTIYTAVATHRTIAFPLPLTKVYDPSSLLPACLLCPSSRYPALPV